MGNEMSCPCSNEYEPMEETKDPDYAVKQDIIKEVMKGRLPKDKLIYEYSCNNKFLYTKVCLISTNNIEYFFNNRNLLIIEKKSEINYYYNSIFLSNFINQNNLTCIILQFNKDNPNERLTTLNSASFYRDSSSPKKLLNNDYSAIYKVENLNFMSKECDKMKEQLLNDLYSQLKRQYRFLGIVSDEQNEDLFSMSFISYDQKRFTSNSALNTISPNAPKSYKLLYKKSKLTDNLDVRYSISILTQPLNEESILTILRENKDKSLISVFEENYFDSARLNKSKLCYFFLFESNKITPEFDESEFLVVKMDKEKNSPDTFLKDIAEKIVMQEDVELLSIISIKTGFYLIFKMEINELDDEDDI